MEKLRRLAHEWLNEHGWYRIDELQAGGQGAAEPICLTKCSQRSGVGGSAICAEI